MTVEQYRQEIRKELRAKLDMLGISIQTCERVYRRLRQSGIDISQEIRDEHQAEYDLHHPELVDPMETER
jgi:chaperonin cofactor prefoldin